MSTTLHLVLADAEVERVPPEAQDHPQVRAYAKTVGKRADRVLLDSSHHHAALKGLPDGERRGRPDLLHLFLLTALESRLNRAGQLRVHVHTRENRLISIDPTTRLIRHYPRFVGLIEQLFETGRVPREGTPLLRMEDGVPLAEVVQRTGAARAMALEVDGEPVAPGPFTRSLVAHPGDACVIVGGFPHGTFRTDIRSVAQTVVSFGKEPLSVWTIAGEILAHASAVLVDAA